MLFSQTFWSCSQQLSPSLQLPGKLQSRQEEEKLNSLPLSGYLVYLKDSLSNRDYLVDTGASRSVFPHHSSAALTGPRLLMADGRSTKAWGSRLIPLQFDTCRFQFQFFLAVVDQPLFGADFLAEFDLLEDTKTSKFFKVPPLNLLHRLGFLPLFPPLPLCVNSLLMLPLSWMSSLQPGKPPEHNVEHVIETEGQPLYARYSHLDQVKLAQAKAEFQKLESAGIIRWV